ncbi:MAG: hypothetical protein U5N85_04430 [Arcicella sp.]|nr:hypothetical protein [Arcicella sp.]
MEATLQQALQVFYDNNNFGEDGGIKEDWVWIKFGVFSFPLPNFEQRKKNVWRHDANHILLGYDTSWKGEAAVSAWEIGSGGWGKFWVAWGLTLWALGVGVIFFPKSTHQAFMRGRNTLSPYLLGIEKDKILATNISQLKDDFKFNDNEYQVKSDDNKAYFTWSVVSVIWFLFPFVISLYILYLLFSLF